MDDEWAIGVLQGFIDDCERHRTQYEREHPYPSPQTDQLKADIMADVPLIERIAGQAWPEWREYKGQMGPMGWEYDPPLAIARQTLILVTRREEIADKLSPTGPTLAASALHPDVWQAAQSQWRHDHFGDAVRAASRSVNAALQNKVGRRDVSEAPLVRESFSLDPPKPGSPRLRLMENDGSDTYRNLHLGAIAFGSGCFTAIRNVLSHAYGEAAEPPEQLALEYLAAFSILARWIDAAERIDAP